MLMSSEHVRCAFCSSCWHRRFYIRWAFFEHEQTPHVVPVYTVVQYSEILFQFHFILRSFQGRWNENLPHQRKCIVKLNKWIRMYIILSLKAGESVCRRQSAVRFNGSFSLALFALELNNSGVLLVCALITDKIKAGKLNCYQPLFVIATSKCL